MTHKHITTPHTAGGCCAMGLCGPEAAQAARDEAQPAPTYPDCYLHVTECRSGQEWVFPLRGNALLDLEHQIKRWAKQEFAGELKLDGKIMPRVEGDYYGKIMTDGRAPDSVVCWTSGGFYLS